MMAKLMTVGTLAVVGAIGAWRLAVPGSPDAQVPSAMERAERQVTRPDVFPNAPTGPDWLDVTPGDGWESAQPGPWYGRATVRDEWILRNGNDTTRAVAVLPIDDSPIGERFALFHQYSAEHIGGAGPEPHFQDVRIGARRIYVGFYAKVSPYFKGHPSSVAKLVYLYMRFPDNSLGRWWVEYRSRDDSSPLQPFIVNRLKTDEGLRPNTGWDAPPPRGTWALHEVYLDLDARDFWWRIDGDLVMSYGPGEWDDANVPADAEWTGVNLSGMLGGRGPTGNPIEQYIAYDRVRVMVAPTP